MIANALDRRRLRHELRAAHAAAPETLNLEARERQAILAALEATRWNKQAAARLLGLHRPTLYAKMRKHGIPQARPTDAPLAPGRRLAGVWGVCHND